MTDLPVLASTAGAVGIIELSRPAKFNALSRQCFQLIDAALTGFEADPAIRALLIRSQGRNFCTGADLDQVGSFGGDGGEATRNSQIGNDVLQRLEASRLPVVAAVQGLALAGGIELMLACDVVFAGKSTRVGDQHARYGLIPGWGGSQRLPRLIGLRRSLDLLFSARWVDAPTALAWGLVNHVVEDDALWDEALGYCTAIAGRNRHSIALMKRLARASLDTELYEGIRLETGEIKGVVESPNVREGVAAFLEKREPVFD